MYLMFNKSHMFVRLNLVANLMYIDQLQNLVTKPLRNIETRLIMQNESFIDFLARKLK